MTPEEAATWFAECGSVKADPFPPYVEPAVPPPLDLTNATGSFVYDNTHLSQRSCAHCKRGVRVGSPRVAHFAFASSTIHNVYHPECVVLP